MRSQIQTDRRIVIISPGFNCEKTVNLWWNSITVQNYDHWICIAVNDMSTDHTKDLLVAFSQTDERLYVVDNKIKKYQLQNWYDVICAPAMTHADVYHKGEICSDTPYINDEDIILFIDLDDWFGTKYAFELTLKEYLYRDIWCTTGRNFSLNDYYDHDGELYYNREQTLQPIHVFSLFSYRAKLFRMIPTTHFYEDKKAHTMYRVCGDYCITMPMLYIAGPNHHQHQFIDRLVIYNNIRTECDDRKMTDTGESEQARAGKLIWQDFMDIYPHLPLIE